MNTQAMPFNQLVKTRYGHMLVNKNDVYIGRSFILYGEISEEENHIYREICKEGDVVVEVGANIGAHTLPISSFIGTEGKLFCYEPQRIVFQTLNANLALNSITNTRTFQAGVGEKNGFIVVPEIDYASQGNFGGVSLHKHQKGENVHLFTLDTHLKLSSLKLLKIDVEGMEIDVLKGAKETIALHQPIIYCENDRKDKAEELVRLLWSYGYEVYWHLPKLYNKDNYNQNDTDIFQNIVSKNLFCLPAKAKIYMKNTIKLEKINK